MEETQKQEMIRVAFEARQKAYAPYSHFQVGAALLGLSGRIYSGCNVENASFGATICAERTAVVKAVSEGETSFQALVVATDGKEPAAPCGICRQFLVEFGPDLVLIMVNLEGKQIETTLAQYLPGAFGPKSMV
jgi:cytidine deaminase